MKPSPNLDDIADHAELSLSEVEHLSLQSICNSWIDALKSLEPSIIAAQKVECLNSNFPNHSFDYHPLQVVQLRAEFVTSPLHLNLDQHPNDFFGMISESSCKFTDVFGMLYKANLYLNDGKDRDFLLCLVELLAIINFQPSATESSIGWDAVKEQQDVYEGDTKYLGYMARDNMSPNRNEFGSICLYDIYSEESSGEEHDNDPWDCD